MSGSESESDFEGDEQEVLDGLASVALTFNGKVLWMTKRGEAGCMHMEADAYDPKKTKAWMEAKKGFQVGCPCGMRATLQHHDEPHRCVGCDKKDLVRMGLYWTHHDDDLGNCNGMDLELQAFLDKHAFGKPSKRVALADLVEAQAKRQAAGSPLPQEDA